MAHEHVIEPLERLGLSPEATSLAVRGWLEAQDRGFGDGRPPPFTMDTQALAAWVPNGHDRVLGGVLAFTCDPQLLRLWVDISYVLPEHRGVGAYRAMWDALVKIAMQNGYLTIESATSANNAVMRAIAKKLHQQETNVQLVYKVRL